MLVGRFLQERVLAKNRAYLLASDGAEGLYTRRVVGNDVSLVRCMEIAEGDALLVGHQDLVPVECQLLGDKESVFSLDWINGESAPRSFSPGDLVPAGAFCQDTRAATMRTVAAFDASTVVSLLRTSTRRSDELARSSPWWKRLTSIYVAAVLLLAVGGFAGWMLVTHDLARTLDVVAGVLIVTCPCAFGIADPARLRARAGALAARRPLRAHAGLPRSRRRGRARRLRQDRHAHHRLARRRRTPRRSRRSPTRSGRSPTTSPSGAPTPRAALSSRASRRMGASGGFDAKRDVREIAGKGLVSGESDSLRLGAPAWACDTRQRDGRRACSARAAASWPRCGPARRLAPALATRCRALEREGYESWVLSGDSAEATRTMAVECGIDGARAFGARTPEGKAAWLHKLVASDAKKTLFVGDGINDSLVAEEAYCAGTPAIDRPFMAARCDFYFVSPGLGPVRAALHMSKRLARVVRTNLAIAIFYNAHHRHARARRPDDAALVRRAHAHLARSRPSSRRPRSSPVKGRGPRGHPDSAGLRQPPARRRLGAPLRVHLPATQLRTLRPSRLAPHGGRRRSHHGFSRPTPAPA